MIFRARDICSKDFKYIVIVAYNSIAVKKFITGEIEAKAPVPQAPIFLLNWNGRFFAGEGGAVASELIDRFLFSA